MRIAGTQTIQDVIGMKTVETSLHIKDVSYQTSCFSKTISDEHYTAKYPLIEMEPRSRIALFSPRDFSERVCYQLTIGNPGELCEPQSSFFNYHDFPPPIMKVEMLERLISFT